MEEIVKMLDRIITLHRKLKFSIKMYNYFSLIGTNIPQV